MLAVIPRVYKYCVFSQYPMTDNKKLTAAAEHAAIDLITLQCHARQLRVPQIFFRRFINPLLIPAPLSIIVSQLSKILSLRIVTAITRLPPFIRFYSAFHRLRLKTARLEKILCFCLYPLPPIKNVLPVVLETGRSSRLSGCFEAVWVNW